MYLFATGHSTCHKQMLKTETKHKLQLYNFIGRIMAVNMSQTKAHSIGNLHTSVKCICLPQGFCSCHKQMLITESKHKRQLYNFTGRIMAVNMSETKAHSINSLHTISA